MAIFTTIMPKFLLLRFSSIGDIVLTTPVIRCLKKQVPGAEIHYATKINYAEVVQHNTYIDRAFFLEDKLAPLLSLLKKEKYDAVIDLHHNLRTLRIKLQLGGKKFSFNKLNWEKWLMVNFKINHLPPIHIVDRYMLTVRSFGITNDGEGLDYFISPADENILQQFPSLKPGNYIGFVIGARHFTKQLPTDKIISICRKLSMPVVLLGGAEDFIKGEEITQSLPGTEIINACGKCTINQSAALVKHSAKIITHDTGLMHIAAAFKKEIISVWGNTIPEFGMSPYFGKHQVKNKTLEIKNLYCRPCSKIGFEKCPEKHFRCMRDIDEAAFDRGF